MLNEKGLAAEMKAAYRGGGYTVAESQGKIMIKTGYIAVRYETKQFPRKCLGLIAEHIGELPEKICYKVSKESGAQTKLLDDELAFWDRIEARLSQSGLHRIKPSPLELSGFWLWQDQESLRVVAVDPEHSRVIDRKFFLDAHTTGELMDGLLWSDTSGEAVVMPRSRSEHNAMLERLDGFPWCGE